MTRTIEAVKRELDDQNENVSGDALTIRLWMEALGAAYRIASIVAKPSSGGLTGLAFAWQQATLIECQARIKALPALANWPMTPGSAFLIYVQDSALELAMRFVRAVTSASLYARTQTFGGFNGWNPPELSEETAKEWRDATAEELRQMTIPVLAEMRFWELTRDCQKLQSLIEDEHRRWIALKETTRSPEATIATPPATALTNDARFTLALTIKAKHPELSDREIGRQTGLNHTTLGRNKTWKSLRNSNRGTIRRGSKSKDGDLEAIDD